MAILEAELKTFNDKRNELLATSEGQFALIHDGQLIGTYNDEQDAIGEGYRRFGNVPFLVMQVLQTEVPANFVNNHVCV